MHTVHACDMLIGGNHKNTACAAETLAETHALRTTSCVKCVYPVNLVSHACASFQGICSLLVVD